MEWKKMPTRPGWYLFAWSLDKWKEAFPVGVMQVTLPSGETTVRRLGGPSDGPGLRTDCILATDGWWYGPVYVSPPDEPKEAKFTVREAPPS